MTRKELYGKSGIYQIKNLVNEKIYVGSAINLYQRKCEHFSDLRKNIHDNPHLQSSYNKYGMIDKIKNGDTWKHIIILNKEGDAL